MAAYNPGDFVRFKPGHIRSRETDIVYEVDLYFPETRDHHEQVWLKYDTSPVCTDHIVRCRKDGSRL